MRVLRVLMLLAARRAGFKDFIAFAEYMYIYSLIFCAQERGF